MKTRILFKFLFIFLIFNGLNAQITMDENHIPQIDDVFIYGIDTVNVNVDAGMPGPNQSWDFSNLASQQTNFQSVIAVPGTPGETDFPTADLTVFNSGAYTYVQTSPDRVEVLGISIDVDGSGTFTPFVFTNPQTYALIPTTYGTAYKDTFAFDLTFEGDPVSGIDSIRVKQVSFRDVEIDAFGTLSTPDGNFEALRQRDSIVTVDSSWVKFFGTWILAQDGVTESEDIQWLTREAKGSMVSLGFSPEGNINSVTYAQLAPLPIPKFSCVETAPGTFQFTDESENQVDSWFWDFGDGATSAEQNPEHTYTASGDYEICLTVTNGSGSLTTCQTKSVSIIVAPVADFSIADDGMGTLTFTDLSTNNPTDWSWDFGDTNMSNDQNPSNTYTTPGDYTICLTASNSAGSDMVCKDFTLDFEIAPVADFDFTDDMMGTLTFTDLSINNPTMWTWDFGDTNTSNEQNPVHTYTATDTYTICLTAENSAGQHTVCEEHLVVSTLEREGIANLSVFPNPANDYLNIEFENLYGNEFRVIMTNALGQRIFESDLQNNMNIEVKDWAQGYYNYQILNKKGEILTSDKVLIIK